MVPQKAEIVLFALPKTHRVNSTYNELGFISLLFCKFIAIRRLFWWWKGILIFSLHLCALVLAPDFRCCHRLCKNFWYLLPFFAAGHGHEDVQMTNLVRDDNDVKTLLSHVSIHFYEGRWKNELSSCSPVFSLIHCRLYVSQVLSWARTICSLWVCSGLDIGMIALFSLSYSTYPSKVVEKGAELSLLCSTHFTNQK